MIGVLIGVIWFLGGAYLLLRPQALKNRLRKKSVSVIRRVLVSLTLFFGGSLLVAAWQGKGLAAKAVLFLGLIALVKGVLLLHRKAATQISSWLDAQPLLVFRVIALLFMLTGGVMILLRHAT